MVDRLRHVRSPHFINVVGDDRSIMRLGLGPQTVTIGAGRAYVFVAVEHANSEVIGIHAARSANRFEALEPVRQGVRGCFGAGATRRAWVLRSHRARRGAWLEAAGSNYMSGDSGRSCGPPGSGSLTIFSAKRGPPPSPVRRSRPVRESGDGLLLLLADRTRSSLPTS
jgi:hypothetical protein